MFAKRLRTTSTKSKNNVRSLHPFCTKTKDSQTCGTCELVYQYQSGAARIEFAALCIDLVKKMTCTYATNWDNWWRASVRKTGEKGEDMLCHRVSSTHKRTYRSLRSDSPQSLTYGILQCQTPEIWVVRRGLPTVLVGGETRVQFVDGALLQSAQFGLADEFHAIAIGGRHLALAVPQNKRTWDCLTLLIVNTDNGFLFEMSYQILQLSSTLSRVDTSLPLEKHFGPVGKFLRTVPSH